MGWVGVVLAPTPKCMDVIRNSVGAPLVMASFFLHSFIHFPPFPLPFLHTHTHLHTSYKRTEEQKVDRYGHGRTDEPSCKYLSVTHSFTHSASLSFPNYAFILGQFNSLAIFLTHTHTSMSRGILGQR